VTVSNSIIIYTDGACLGNPGPGGYAAILVRGSKKQEFTGGFRQTTNNRMELLAAISGLQALPERSRVTLYSDSKYLVDNLTNGNVARWQAKSWRLHGKISAKNVDLWEQLLDMCRKHEVDFRWVMGHAGNPLNERCDRLSMQAAYRHDLPADIAFEQGTTTHPKTGTLF
jgi:ribonuclease HI